ncbi:MAG: radical SAM protein [Deltaproteobacteria bacterium]|nr:radical SAM protein [Deltaproteobacteria bacterium]
MSNIEFVGLKSAPSKSLKLKGKKVHVTDQVSCTNTRIYMKRYEDFVQYHGAVSTKNIKEADIILVDTCAVTQQREDMSLEMVKKSETLAKGGAKIIVCGCLAGINPKRLQEYYKGDFFSPKNEKHLAQILDLDEEEAKFLDPYNIRGRFMGADYTDVSLGLRLGIYACTLAHQIDNVISLHWIPWLGRFLDYSQAANVKAYAISVSQGCLGNCSFCVIPMSKGETASLPISFIIEKIQSLCADGVKKIILTSEDVGAYGVDLGATVVDLLEHIHRIKEEFYLYINFIDPRWLRLHGSDLVKISKLGKIRFLQFPLQSGSNSVLRRMRRAYQMEQVLPHILEFRRRAPKVTLGTQIIAGFPGETLEELEETRQIVKKNYFHRTDIIDFTNRPGADTEKMDSHLPQDEIRKRVCLLQKEIRTPFIMPSY